MSEAIINMVWDSEACVWYATSDDVPGLVLESGSFDTLVERVRAAIPELAELNHFSVPHALNFRAERRERLAG